MTLCGKKELCISTAGHDKNRLYVIIGENEKEVCLADGVHAFMHQPKRKNRRHIIRITELPVEVETMTEKIRNDSDLVHILRVYRKQEREKQEDRSNRQLTARTSQ